MGAGCSSQNSGGLVTSLGNIPNFKIVFIGETGVGKTNVIRRFVHNQFDYSYKPTQKVAIENVVKKLNVPNNCVASLTIWDVPGHEDMDLRSTYYRNADAVVVTVDLSEDESLLLAGSWRQDFINKVTKTQDVIETLPSGIQTIKVEPVKGFDPAKIPVLLLGNKYDLVEEKIAEEKMKAMIDGVVETPDEFEVDGLADLEDILNDDMPNDQKCQDDVATKNKTNEGGRTAVKDKRPECIKEMEALQEKFGFMSSVAVAAKDKNGSVDAAMQALVRHLLGKTTFKA